MKTDSSQVGVAFAVSPAVTEEALGVMEPPVITRKLKTSMRRRNYSLERAFLALLVTASIVLFILQIAKPVPIHLAGMTIDRLSSVLTLLVAGVGAVNFQFSLRYLDGDPRQGRFMKWLLFSVVCAYVLMLASHLLLLAAAWSMTSMGLHQLLTHCPHRVDAFRAARKKFLISRLGDLALAGLIICVWWNWHTFDLNEVFARLPVETSGAMTAAAVLIVLAAVTKSAQVPFHSWLPETMESPTPVSALMHAGIINAGGALLLRTAPLISRVPESLLLLSVIGTVTAVLGAICMWAQVKVKRTLAWSTVSQMGFMTAQCGLCAFPAALLHIIAHGCYKAWSFLRAGGLGPAAGASAPVSAGRRLLCVAGGILAAGLTMPLASRLTGFAPLHSPGETALAAVLALSMGQLWAAILGPAWSRSRSTILYPVMLCLGSTAIATVLAFGLYGAASWYLSAVVGLIPEHGHGAGWLAAALPVVGLVGLTIFHALLPTLAKRPIGFALRVHALHGFYLGAIADRIVEVIWNFFSKRSNLQ